MLSALLPREGWRDCFHCFIQWRSWWVCYSVTSHPYAKGTLNLSGPLRRIPGKEDFPARGGLKSNIGSEVEIYVTHIRRWQGGRCEGPVPRRKVRWILDVMIDVDVSISWSKPFFYTDAVRRTIKSPTGIVGGKRWWTVVNIFYSCAYRMIGQMNNHMMTYKERTKEHERRNNTKWLESSWAEEYRAAWNAGGDRALINLSAVRQKKKKSSKAAKNEHRSHISPVLLRVM